MFAVLRGRLLLGWPHRSLLRKSRHIFVTSECCGGHKMRVVRIENTGSNHIQLISQGLKGTNSVPGHHSFNIVDGLLHRPADSNFYAGLVVLSGHVTIQGMTIHDMQQASVSARAGAST